MARSLSTYLGIFLIAIGILPFLGVGFGGLIQQIINVLVIVSGVILILSQR